KGDAEQDHGNQVAGLELEELEGGRTGALVPTELLVREVEPPGGDERDQPHGQEPQDQRNHDRFGPCPLEVPDEGLETLDLRPGPLLESSRNQSDCELHRSRPSRGDPAGLYRQALPLKRSVARAGGQPVRSGGRLVKAFTSIESTMPRGRGLCNLVGPRTLSERRGAATMES